MGRSGVSCATLTTMLNLAAERGKLLRVPKIRKPRDGKPRQGFLEPEQCAAVARHLAPDLQVATAIGYTLGMADQEVLTRERRHLDLEAGTLRLGQDETKSGQPRIAYLPPELTGLCGITWSASGPSSGRSARRCPTCSLTSPGAGATRRATSGATGGGRG